MDKWKGNLYDVIFSHGLCITNINRDSAGIDVYVGIENYARGLVMANFKTHMELH